MNRPSRRKELKSQYKQVHPEAGVYRVVNTQNNKVLLGSTPNLAGIRNKLAFARSTNSPSALDHRLHYDIRQYGIDAFAFEVLDILDIKPEATRAEIMADLATLESLWREKLDADLLY